MTLYRLLPDSVELVPQTSLHKRGVWERADLQRLLRDRIEILLEDTLVLAEEFGDWEDSGLRVDLLCLAQDGGLVVVELKRGDTGSHMDLQAIRYAAMVSPMTFDDAVAAHARFLRKHGRGEDAQQRILAFLGWAEPDEGRFAQDVGIVLVSEDFSTELTTAVLWLNGRGLDISCIRLHSYEHNGEHLVQFEPIIPLPEAADYEVRIRDKELEASRSREQRRSPAPELVAAAEAYEHIARPEFPVSGRARNYRQVHPLNWPDPKAVHYEFLLAPGKHLGVEVHIERAVARPVADLLRPLDGECLDGIPIPLVWDQRWMAGKGRLTCRLPLDTEPYVAARAMDALIARTHSPVTSLLVKLKLAGSGDASGEGEEDE